MSTIPISEDPLRHNGQRFARPLCGLLPSPCDDAPNNLLQRGKKSGLTMNPLIGPNTPNAFKSATPASVRSSLSSLATLTFKEPYAHKRSRKQRRTPKCKNVHRDDSKPMRAPSELPCEMPQCERVGDRSEGVGDEEDDGLTVRAVESEVVHVSVPERLRKRARREGKGRTRGRDRWR